MKNNLNAAVIKKSN